MNESTTFEVAYSVFIALNTEAVENVHGIYEWQCAPTFQVFLQHRLMRDFTLQFLLP